MKIITSSEKPSGSDGTSFHRTSSMPRPLLEELTVDHKMAPRSGCYHSIPVPTTHASRTGTQKKSRK